MAHTIDHKEEEIRRIWSHIEKQSNKVLNTGKKVVPFAQKIWEGTKEFKDARNPLNWGHNIGAVGARGVEAFATFDANNPQEFSMELVEKAMGKKGIGAAMIKEIPAIKPYVVKAEDLAGQAYQSIVRRMKGSQVQPAFAGAGGPNVAAKSTGPSNVLQIQGGEGIVTPTKLTSKIRELLKNIDPDLAVRDVAKRYADNPEFMQQLIKFHGDARKYVDGPGGGRLANYPGQRTLTSPDGIKYRVRDSNPEGGLGKFSINQDVSAKNTAEIRKIAQQPDKGSLKKIFSEYVPKSKVDSVLESYNQTNKKIYTALTEARKRYNIGKPKNLQTSIEHIFDVDFYKRLKKEVPGFSGKGADEAWNLKMISYVLNSKTGAINKKAKDIGQVLIDAMRRDEFVDYNKVVEDFVQNDLGTKINKLKPKDWDKITEFSMKNTNLNMQKILVEYTKNL